jgi:hypothetical protein
MRHLSAMKGVMTMKRLVFAAATAVVVVLAIAQPAFADYPPKPGHQHPSTSVAPKLITKAPSGGIAFTGADVVGILLVALALAVVGLGLLWAARRAGRRVPTAGS